MIIAVHQPQFLPYLGFFDKMMKADVFVLLDNVQFTKNEWQNRNRIRTPTGWQWLTVPIFHRFGQRIRDVKICDTINWRKKHVHALQTNYCSAPRYEQLQATIDATYQRKCNFLLDVNIDWTNNIREILHIDKPVFLASELGALPDLPNERLISIVQHFNGDTYLSGIGGREYLDLSKFERAGIAVIFQEFQHPVYAQQFHGFEPNLSAIDFLLNCENS
ncbi:WbqC family protein [candidate division KSB1 bacterium]|nr:WbqC family protein [candidate division KSB1 bacterium]